MSDNNSFLNNYSKKTEEDTAAPPKKLNFEEKSGFKKPERSGPRPPESSDKKRLKTALIAGGCALVVIVIVLVIVFSGGGVEIIDFTNRPLTDAKLWANENGVMLSQKEAYSDTIEDGNIIEQDIMAGEKLTKGSFLTLTVSLGHDMNVLVTLPDIKSMTANEVQKWADENFMSKVRISAEYSADIAEGKVISFTVNDTTVVEEVRRDSSILVIVSKGPEEAAATVKVPNLKEKSLAECFTFATENGLTLTVKEEFDDYIPAGTIISQSVKMDQMVAKGSEIILVVSKGKMITVPDFSDYTKEEATALATKLGLPFSIAEKYSSSSTGRLISQSIEEGSIYEDGNLLELTYSLGNKIVLASYVGQTRDALESWAQGLNDQGARITIKATEAKSNQPRGTIIYQDKTSTSVSYKTTINITVSAGNVVYVPDFTGPMDRNYNNAITREKAIKICEEAGLIPVFVQDGSGGVLPGEIWSQSVAPGTEVNEGTTITLLYRPAGTVTVPHFVGASADESKYHLISLDIIFADGIEEGTVVSQSLAADSTVAAGSVITLTMSGAPTESDPPTVSPSATESAPPTGTPEP